MPRKGGSRTLESECCERTKETTSTLSRGIAEAACDIFFFLTSKFPLFFPSKKHFQSASSTPTTTTPRNSTSNTSSSSSVSLLLSKIKSLASSVPALPLPDWSPDVFNAVLNEAPARARKHAASAASAARSRLAHPRPGILAGDDERHIAISMLGAALLLWLAAAVFGAAAGDGGACVAGGKRGATTAATSSLAAAASCVRGGKLPLLWFDGLLRSLGPLLTLPLLLSRAVAHRSSFIGSSSSSSSSRPIAHFVHVAAVYAAAAAARLSVFLPHRSGHLARVAEGAAWSATLPFRTLSAVVGRVVGNGGGSAAQSSSFSSSPLSLVRGLAARAAAAAAPVTSLLPFGSSFSFSSASSNKTKHLMSDHLFLGSCVGAMLVAEGVLLVADARRHKSSSKINRLLLLAAAAACAVLYGALCVDMAFTAAYFHARRETAAAVVAGLVAFQAPLAVWLLGGVAGAKRAARGVAGRVLSFSASSRKSAARQRR